MVIGVSVEGPLTPPQGGIAKDPVTTDISCQLLCSALLLPLPSLLRDMVTTLPCIG